MARNEARDPARKPPRRRAYTLMEVVVVMTIMGVLISIPAPIFSRVVEQSRLDIAAANLRAIWGAQRYFYLEKRGFGTLADLAGTGGLDSLVDPSLGANDSFYRYEIDVGVDGQTFVATATHPETPRCSGSITIDEAGTLAGDVLFNGQPLALSVEFAK
jgi:prepilin-type N-terminal cleavage/methylation domain-containing protein